MQAGVKFFLYGKGALKGMLHPLTNESAVQAAFAWPKKQIITEKAISSAARPIFFSLAAATVFYSLLSTLIGFHMFSSLFIYSRKTGDATLSGEKFSTVALHYKRNLRYDPFNQSAKKISINKMLTGEICKWSKEINDRTIECVRRDVGFLLI